MAVYIEYSREVRAKTKEMFGGENVLYGLILTGNPVAYLQLRRCLDEITVTSAEEILDGITKTDGEGGSQFVLEGEARSHFASHSKREEIEDLLGLIVTDIFAAMRERPELLVQCFTQLAASEVTVIYS